jgi:hypothetical protein
MCADNDVAVFGTEAGDDIPPVVAELLHPHVETGLLKLIEDVLGGFGGARLT